MNDLTEDKDLLLQQFRVKVQDILHEDHDDMFLLRWLEARKFDLEKAEHMLGEHMRFRKKYAIDRILETPRLKEDILPYERTAFLGFGYEGQAVRLLNLEDFDARGYYKSLTSFDIMWHLSWSLEHDLMKLKENNKKTGKNTQKGTVIFDLNGFKVLPMFDKSIIKKVIAELKFVQDNYPELVDTLFVINAPRIFSSVFSIVTPVIDENVLRKVKVYSGGWEDDVFRKIPREIVPAYLGGTRFDPPGDPRCNGFLKWKIGIPKHLYLCDSYSMQLSDPNVIETVIKERSFFATEVEVREPSATLRWEFEVKDHNVKFGLFYKNCRSAQNNTPEGIRQMEEILQLETSNNYSLMEKGQLKCNKSGTYVFYFDNTYSWFRSKNLLYKIEVICNDERGDRNSDT